MRKEIYQPYFKDKKVTVMGLGLLGRGLGDTAFLAENGASLVVTDKKTKEQLSSSLDALNLYKDIKYVLGEHKLEDFENRDFVLEAAGVPYDSEYIMHAKKNNVPVYMSASLLCDIVMKNLPNTVIIGITGTRGKSTTTQMIAHILKENNMRVLVGGNIRGIANLPILEDMEDGDYLVLELDSWQLQGFGEMKISPHISVFTNLLDDHMNYYKDDKERYFSDKANIYRFQKREDILIGSAEARDEILKRDKKVSVVVPEEKEFKIPLLGKHNQILAGLAYEVASQCGIDDESITNALTTFNAVEGRLEDLGLHRGVRVFNDNNATTPDATVIAIKSIEETYNRKPIVILGGGDKGLSVTDLENTIKDLSAQAGKAGSVIYLSGAGTSRISLTKEFEYEKLSDCIDKAFELAKEGDIILFSPGFVSFSKYFNNEYERNDEFVKVLKKYK